MRKFYLHYFVNTLASISLRLNHQKNKTYCWRFLLSDKNEKIYLIDSLKDYNGLKLHQGLEFLVCLREVNKPQAISKSRILVESIINLIFLETLASCKPAKLLTVLEIKDSEAIPVEFFIYPFNGYLPIASPIQIDKDKFDLLWEAFKVSRRKDRIMRSLSWFRKGVYSENIVDEFISYWIALEVLEPLQRKCERWDGIKSVFEQKEVNCPYKFTEIKETREKLFHGFQELNDNFVNKLGEYLEPLIRALLYTLLCALNINKKSIDYGNFIIRKPRRIRLKPYIKQEGFLKNLPKNGEELMENFPKIEADIKNIIPGLSRDGTINLEIKANFRYNLPRNSIFTLTAQEFWGDEESGIKII